MARWSTSPESSIRSDAFRSEAMMVTVRDGNPGNRPVRRLRFDRYPPEPEARRPGRAGHSGRRLVLVSGLALLLITGGLALRFRDWRVHYRERAAFGAREVATAID